MQELPVPAEQKRAFDDYCHGHGMHPEGFDVHAYASTRDAERIEMAIRINGREYKYPTALHESSWIAQFFKDLNRDSNELNKD